MKKQFLVFIAMLLAIASNASATDKLSIEDFELLPGETKTVSLLLDNPDVAYRDLQFDLYLPSGITVVQDEYDEFLVTKGSRCTNKHAVAFSYKDGHYVCMLYSTGKQPLTDNSGEVLSITLKADENAATGAKTGYFRNVKLSKTDATGPTYSEFAFSLTIKNAEEPVTVTANNLTMVYGDIVPALTYTTTGAELNGTPVLSTTATQTSAVGTYPITVTQGTVTNTEATYVNGTLTITKAPLTVGVQNVTISEGDAIPTFTLTYSGWKNGDTEANAFIVQPTATTTATANSTAGTYDITVSGGTAQNYALTYQKGTLTIQENEQPVAMDSKDLPLTRSMFKRWDGFDATAQVVGDGAWDAAELGTTASSGNTVYGTSAVYNTDYADVTGATTLRIVGTAGVELRVMMNRQADDSWTELNPIIGEEGYADVNLSTYEYVHINAIKLDWNSPAGAITAFILNPTQSDLTTDMFHQWTLEEPVEITPQNPYCALNLFQNENNIYGDSGVSPDNFADLAGWDYLTIAATNGTPRLIFNRIYNPEAEYGTEEWKGSDWLEINSTDNQYVVSAENDIIVYDLKAIREDCNGMVRLHAIKGKWGPATIHAMKLSTVEPATITWRNITVADNIQNGTVTASFPKTVEGAPVTLTATPDEGSELTALTVTAGGTNVATVSDDEHPNVFTFTMPAADVTVSATFKQPTSPNKNLTKDMFHEWDGCTATSKVTKEDCGGALNLGTNLPSGSLVYGDASVQYTHYADLTGYNTLLITGTPGMQLRMLMNRLEVGNGGGDANGGAYTELNPTIGTDGTVAVDLSGYEFVHLNSIKTGWSSPEGIIESLKVSTEKMEQPDAIEDVKADGVTSVRKVFRKGRIVIIKNGKEYSVDGTLLK